MAWLSGYSKRKPLTLTGGASGALSDFQLSIAVSYEAAMQGDFDDIRFTRADGTTLVDAWAEVIINDTSATVWVEFPSTPANTVEQTYYMYYGNGSAASDWDIGATFLFGDDFPGASLDTNKWLNSGGTASVSSGILDFYGADHNLRSKIKTSYNTVTQGRFKSVTTGPDTSFGALEGYDSGQAWHYNLLRYYHTDNGDEVAQRIKTGTNATTTIRSGDTNWCVYEIIRNSTTSVIFKKDGGTDLTETNTTYIPTADMSAGCRSQSSRHVQLDWVFVRKYASGPPTYAFGSEESAPIITMLLLSHLYNQLRQ